MVNGNGKNGAVYRWVIGILISVGLVVSVAVLGSITSDVKDNENRLDKLEQQAKVDEYRWNVLNNQHKEIIKLLKDQDEK